MIQNPAVRIQNWKELELLAGGSVLQRAAYLAISDLNLKDFLKDFQPTIVGDLALGLLASEPLIKIVCSTPDLKGFIEALAKTYWDRPKAGFDVKPVSGIMTALAQFQIDRFVVRVTAQQRPVHEQIAGKVFVAQMRLLAHCKPEVRENIERLREAGVKVDWAFANVFELGTDPRRALSGIADLSPREAEKRLSRFLALRRDPAPLHNGTENPSALSATSPKQPTKIIGHFHKLVQMGVWGHLRVSEDQVSLKIAPEIRHDFDRVGKLLTVIYVVSSTPREVTFEITRVEQANENAAGYLRLHLTGHKKLRNGEYEVVAIWERKKRVSDVS